MPRKKRREREPFFGDLSSQAKQGIWSVVFIVLAIFFVLSSFEYAGPAGAITYQGLSFLFGMGYLLAPLACLLVVYILFRPRENGGISISKTIGLVLLLLSLLGLLSIYDAEAGGLLGTIVGAPLSILLGTLTAGILLGAFLLIGAFLTFNMGLPFGRKKEDDATKDDFVLSPVEVEQAALASEIEDAEPEERDADAPIRTTERASAPASGAGFAVSHFSGPYEPPPLSLLEKDRGKARTGDVKASANLIKRTLQNFNINVEMDEVSIGPSVTRFALKPAEGVRISKIVSLQNNLELALAAHPIRIEAPIPGKSLVGIEVPNTAKATVGLASLLATPEYTDSPKPLLVALGRDIAGSVSFANLAKMPHLLIAGTTGSGKSVTIHAVITSLLFRNSPEQLRFIMVDPKRVELTLYNGIPHLLTPVITDAKKTILALKWAAKEMERRYDILQAEKVRDLESYHKNVYEPAVKKRGGDKNAEEGGPEPLPYIVIIIDELADIMQTYPRELEASIVRLAQMSRAVGIHLILSTQRPSVNVITGLIKANVPARIALQVASQIDSRTILDQVGAEKLLGAGDMLFLSGELSKPTRIQSAFITEDELKRVTSYLKDQSDAQTLDSIDLSGDSEKGSDLFAGVALDEDADDDLFEDAKQTVISAGKASTSYLQRRLGIGYSRAARLIDLLEERGVIGPGHGARPREILVGRDGGGDDTDEPT